MRTLYSGHKVSSVEVMFYFLAAYSTHLENELTTILQDKRVVLFRDSLLPRPENGPEPRREKRESCITCSRMLGRTPFFPPKLGENRIWKEIPNLNIAYSQWFYTDKFLEAIGFAFKKCQFNFVPKAEQVQGTHAVVTGNDV